MAFDAANVCGILIVIFGTMSFTLNGFMIIIFILNGLVSWKHTHAVIYRLILNFLVTDTIQVVPTIYIGLCAALQRSLLSIDLEIAIAAVNLWMWFQIALMLIIMAVNRVIGVSYLHLYNKLFTARNVYLIIFFTWLLSGTLMLFEQFLTPCCAMTSSFYVFTFLYYNPNNEINYTTKYYIPITEVCVGVLVLSYTWVLIKLRQHAQEVASSLTQTAQRRRARQNARFAVQFVLISLFYVLMFIFYSILPKIVPAGVLLPYSSIAFCMVANCSINSIMYLLLNPEISRLAKQTLCCKRRIGPTFETETGVRRTQLRSIPLN